MRRRPRRERLGVVVGEQQEPPRAAAAPALRAAAGPAAAPEEAERELGVQADAERRRLAAVVHDDHLEECSVPATSSDAEALEKVRGAVAARDHDCGRGAGPPPRAQG